MQNNRLLYEGHVRINVAKEIFKFSFYWNENRQTKEE